MPESLIWVKMDDRVIIFGRLVQYGSMMHLHILSPSKLAIFFLKKNYKKTFELLLCAH